MNTSTCIGCSPTASPSKQALAGWTPESPGRGTLTIIISSLVTTFLCTWVVIHARVCNRPLFHAVHKFILFLKCIVAPEFIAVEGLQEWTQARRLIRDCKNLTSGRLKSIHAFYIGMLALRYRTPRGEKVIWPNQYTWLLEQKLLDWAHHESWGLSEADIRDKSNADSAVKLLALVQVSWFVAQSIMRRAHNLPLSQLESMTLSYIPLVAITYFFWWVKPKDIMTPSIVDLPEMSPGNLATFESMAVSNAFDNEGVGQQRSWWSIWALTPRVFEKEYEQRRLKEAQESFIEKAEHKELAEECSKPDPYEERFQSPEIMNDDVGEKTDSAWEIGRPITLEKEIVLAFWDPEVYHSRILWPIICLFGSSFGALHLISWNSTFPSQVEQWLWRAAGLVSVISMLVFMQFEKVVLRCGGPLTMISLLSPAVYLLSRIVMIGGVIAAFRASNPAIYDTYHVSNYWLHVL